MVGDYTLYFIASVFVKKALLFISLSLLALVGSACGNYNIELEKFKSEDPRVWEEDIAEFEKEDEKGKNPANPVVFVGSSSIRFWDSLIEDMAPIPVVQRGFGGAKFNDVVYYADRLVSVHKPSAVVLFVGTNDISSSGTKSPEVLLASYKKFVEIVRLQQSHLPIYYIAITQSNLRWEHWAIAQKTNQLIINYTKQDENLYVIDTSSALMGADGKPDATNYRLDRLHLNEKGYAKWTNLIKPYIFPYAEAE